MVQVKNFITVMPSGYGHNEVTIYLTDGDKLTAKTSRTLLTDKYRSENDDEAQEAKEELIDLVLTAHGIEEFEIEK